MALTEEQEAALVKLLEGSSKTEDKPAEPVIGSAEKSADYFLEQLGEAKKTLESLTSERDEIQGRLEKIKTVWSQINKDIDLDAQVAKVKDDGTYEYTGNAGGESSQSTGSESENDSTPLGLSKMSDKDLREWQEKLHQEHGAVAA